MTESTAISAGATPRSDSSPCFDHRRLMELVDGDMDLLREVVGLFFEDAPAWLETMRDAAETDDAEALFGAAHAMKGAVSNFAADTAMSVATMLEEIGRSGNLEGAPSLVARLEEELLLLSAELESLLA